MPPDRVGGQTPATPSQGGTARQGRGQPAHQGGAGCRSNRCLRKKFVRTPAWHLTRLARCQPVGFRRRLVHDRPIDNTTQTRDRPGRAPVILPVGSTLLTCQRRRRCSRQHESFGQDKALGQHETFSQDESRSQGQPFGEDKALSQHQSPQPAETFGQHEACAGDQALLCRGQAFGEDEPVRQGVAAGKGAASAQRVESVAVGMNRLALRGRVAAGQPVDQHHLRREEASGSGIPTR